MNWRPGRRGSTAALTLAMVSAISCAPTENGTALVVNVDSELGAPDINLIAITVRTEGDTQRSVFPVASATPSRVSVAVVPKGKPDFPVEVEARGEKDGSPYVSQVSSVRFVPGRQMQITLNLLRSCVGQSACDSASTCSVGGACVSRATVATLEPYSGIPETDGAAATNADGGTPDLAPPRAGTWAPDNVGLDPLADLRGVHSDPAGMVWAVGQQGGKGVVFTRSGSVWSSQLVPAGTAALQGVWSADEKHAWAVGLRGQVLGLDSGGLLQMQVIPTAADLSAIWGSAPDAVWAVGLNGTILRFDGMRWGEETSGTTAGLLSVWGAGGGTTGVVYVVGAGGTILRRAGVDAGGVWTKVASPTTNILYGVWVDSPLTAHAVGSGVALHLSGAQWRAVPSPLVETVAVWGNAANDVWSVAAGGAQTVARFDGAAWVVQATPATGIILSAVRGVRAGPVYAVGTGGFAMRFSPM